MRDLITGLAVLLLLALAAAFAGPHLIDWERQRAEINRQLSAALGREVRVDGPIGLTLLPTPFVKLGHVKLSGDGPLSGTIGRIRAAAAAPALLRGEIRLTSVEIDGARLSLRTGRADTGAMEPPPPVSIQKLAIRGSTLELTGANGTPLGTVDAVSGDLEAVALEGPWRGSLAFTHAGRARMLRFSTGKAAAGSMRLRALVEDEAAAMRAEYDGSVGLQEGRLALDGKLSASGNLEMVLAGQARSQLWRVQGLVRGDARRALIEDVEIAVGPSDRQVIASGGAEVSLADSRGTVTLAARQIDFDRLLAEEGNTRPPVPEALLRELAARLGSKAEARTGLSGTVDLTAGSLILGGGVIAGPRVTLRMEGGGLASAAVSGELPGRAIAKLDLAGAEGGPFSLDVADMAALSGWFHQDPQARATFRRLSIHGTAATVAGGIRISDAAIRADDMRFAGSATLLAGAERPRLALNLTSDRLDVARLPGQAGDGGPPGFDLDLELDARRVSYNGVGAGSVRASLSRIGPNLDLRNIGVDGLGGASLRVSGSPATGFRGELAGERLDAVIDLLERLLPHPAFPYLKARAAALAPAKLAFSATPGTAGAWLMAGRGTLGGSTVEGEAYLGADGGLSPSGGMRLGVRSGSATTILRQLGVPAIPVATSGPGDLVLAGEALAEGRREAPWSLKGTLGGLAIDLAGVRRNDPAEAFAGRLSLAAADIFPLAQSLLVTAPRIPPGTGFALSGGIDLRGAKITIRDVDMKVGGAPVAGEIAFNLAEFGRVQGQLRTPVFDFGLLAPMIFGEPQPPSGDSFSAATFNPPAAPALPGDLWIEAADVHIMPGLAARNAGFIIRFDNGLLFLEHARAEFGGLRAEAQGTLRRTGRSVSLAGRASLAGQHEALRARIGGSLDVTALGESPVQLMAALSGTGVLRHSGVDLPALRPGVFSAIADRPTIAGQRSVVMDTLRGALDQRLATPPGDLRLTLGGGVLRTQPLTIDDPGHAASATASLDLRQRQFTGRMAFTARQAPKDWSGPPPQAAFVWRGPPEALRLDIEADDLANGVTALAIRRETDRIEALEQDQRERAFFNRRLRAAEQERRAAEEARQRELQERIRAEQQRVERERQQAEEAARAAPVLQPQLQLLPPLQILPNAIR